MEDRRLQKVNNAVLGVNEGSGSDGGFAIQTDFAGMILESAVQQSPLLNRMDRYTCSSAANSMRWISADETDVSKSVFGGIQMYWAAEGATVAASKPQFRELKMDLEKMMGFLYCTDEMLSDSAFMSSFAGPSFALAADRLLTESSISGDGVGKPLGLLRSKALVEVAKEASQEAGTFVGANAIKMQARAMPRGRERLVWLMHPDLEEQLPYLSIQSGEAAKFLWNPEGGLGNFDTQRVLNKPVLFEDSCASPGVRGDALLVDPYMYILLTKGTVKQDWSIHVEFLTDQNCFRVVYRCNGAPKVNKPLTIKNSSKTVKISLVGKYVKLHDSYLSIVESLHHAGWENGAQVEINWVDSETITPETAPEILGGSTGIIVPGGFGIRGIEGMIAAADYARRNNIPYFGICLGMQIAAIAFARGVLGYEDANSTEFAPDSKHPVIALMEEQMDLADMGGTMRLGAYPCRISPYTLMMKAYGKGLIEERHRHRYEFNNKFREVYMEHGAIFSGQSPDGTLVEAMEIPGHPFYLGVQYHPEFKSRPNRAHPIFREFVKAALEVKEKNS